MKSQDPTPAEIAEACREIQKTWTEAERERRLRCDWRGGVKPLEPQRIEAGVGVNFS